MSFPSPPSSVSVPPAPAITSSPAPPLITLAAAPAEMMVSLLTVPVIFSIPVNSSKMIGLPATPPAMYWAVPVPSAFRVTSTPAIVGSAAAALIPEKSFVSMPSPPSITSVPPPPEITSSPAPPLMTLAAAPVAVMVSLSSEPMMFSMEISVSVSTTSLKTLPSPVSAPGLSARPLMSPPAS